MNFLDKFLMEQRPVINIKGIFFSQPNEQINCLTKNCEEDKSWYPKLLDEGIFNSETDQTDKSLETDQTDKSGDGSFPVILKDGSFPVILKTASETSGVFDNKVMPPSSSCNSSFILFIKSYTITL